MLLYQLELCVLGSPQTYQVLSLFAVYITLLHDENSQIYCFSTTARKLFGLSQYLRLFPKAIKWITQLSTTALCTTFNGPSPLYLHHSEMAFENFIGTVKGFMKKLSERKWLIHEGLQMSIIGIKTPFEVLLFHLRMQQFYDRLILCSRMVIFHQSSSETCKVLQDIQHIIKV